MSRNKIIYTTAILLSLFFSVMDYGQGTPADLPVSVTSNTHTVLATAANNYICKYGKIKTDHQTSQ